MSTHGVLRPLLRYEPDDPPHGSAEDAHHDQAPKRSSEHGQTRLTRGQDGSDQEGFVSDFGDDLRKREGSAQERREQNEGDVSRSKGWALRRAGAERRRWVLTIMMKACQRAPKFESSVTISMAEGREGES